MSYHASQELDRGVFVCLQQLGVISALILTYMNWHEAAGLRCVWGWSSLWLTMCLFYIISWRLSGPWETSKLNVSTFSDCWGPTGNFCLHSVFSLWRRFARSPWRTPSAWLHSLWNRFSFLLTAQLLRIRSQMAWAWFGSWMLTWTG